MAVKNQKENKLCVLYIGGWKAYIIIQVIHILGKLDLMYLVEKAKKKEEEKKERKNELWFLFNFLFFYFCFR